MVIKSRLKGKRGIITSDAVISIIVVMLFTGVIMSLMVNVVLETQKIKMNSQQTDLAIEVLEHIKTLSYNETTESNLIAYINTKNLDYVSAGTATESLTTPYKIAIDVQNYNETEGNRDKLDIIKIIEVRVETVLNDKEYSTVISTIKKATMEEVEAII